MSVWIRKVTLNFCFMMMKIIAWNCHGPARRKFWTVVKEMCRVHRLDLFAMVEIRISGRKAREVIRGMGFKRFEVEKVGGFSGGIWVCWKDEELEVEVIRKENQFMHLMLCKQGSLITFYTIVYANLQGV